MLCCEFSWNKRITKKSAFQIFFQLKKKTKTNFFWNWEMMPLGRWYRWLLRRAHRPSIVVILHQGPHNDHAMNIQVYHHSSKKTVQFSHSVMSNSLWPYELQHARPPCPSPTPRIHPNSWSHYFMGNIWIYNGNSEKICFLGLQNHCRWWLQPWN